MEISNHIPTGEFEFNGIKLGYSSFNTDWIHQLGIVPRVIFDIGGYDAGDAIRLKEYFPYSDVFCFEADDERCTKISEYIGKSGVIFEQRVVTSKSGVEVDFYPSICNTKDAGDTHTIGSRGGQGSAFIHAESYRSNYPQIVQSEKPISVLAESVESICKRYQIDHIDVAHIDVEGSEYDVVWGFGEHRPTLVFLEVLDGMFKGVKPFSELHALMKDMGYNMIKDCGTDKLYLHKPIITNQ